MAPLWVVAVRRTARRLSTRQVPLLSLGAAFCFAIQMFNIPAVGGTTAHAVGATLLAIVLGPWAALLAVTLALAVQALFFGDGGILALTTNTFNMGFVAAFSGYGVYRLISGGAEAGSPRALVAAGVGAFVGSVLSAASTGLWLGVQPLIARDEMGRALYFPFGVNVAVPAMVHIHLLVAAPAEAVVTVAALAFLRSNFSELLQQHRIVRVDKPLRLGTVLLVLLLLTPLGLIATGSAWGEWDEQTLEQLIGYVPVGIRQLGEGLVQPLLPDYTFPGREGKGWEIVGYIFSAIVGALLTALAARAVVRRPVPIPVKSGEPIAPLSGELPAWLKHQQPSQSMEWKGSVQRRWLERTLLHVRETVASAFIAEEWARRDGYLQRIHPAAKTIAAIATLVAVAVSRSVWLLGGVVAGIALLVVLSQLPFRQFAGRVVAPVCLFGLLLALPLALQVVTPGQVLWQPFGWELLAVSDAGARASALLVLRLTAAIGVTLLWSTTTRWHWLMRSLRMLFLPPLLITALTLTYRYLFSLVEVLAEMLLARRSRQIAPSTAQMGRLYAGAGAAVLLAKSAEMNEQVHLAMRSRGFDGEMRGFEMGRWQGKDVGWLLLVFGFLMLLHWLGG